MRKALPFLTTLLILTILYFLKSNISEIINIGDVEIKLLDRIGTHNLPGVISLCVLSLIAIITLFTIKYTSLQIWLLYLLIASFVLRLFIGDISININFLPWFPVFKLSYLTSILASVIIILSLLLEDGSYNEQKN